MPAQAIVETHADREALASIWTAILAPWPRAADLAHLLGVDRSLLCHYASGRRSPGWPATRAGAAGQPLPRRGLAAARGPDAV